MPIEIAGNQPGFKVWAIVSSLGLAVLCLLAGVSVMFGEHIAEEFDAELPGGMKMGMRFGLLGIAMIWCGYMALLVWAATRERRRGWHFGLMLGWVLLAVWYTGIVSFGFLACFASGTKSVM